MALLGSTHMNYEFLEEVHRPAPTRQRAVLLVNTGSPDNPDIPSVRRYLAQFLSDPLVVQLPGGLGWLQDTLGRLIARLRASYSTGLYRKIWTDQGSPLVVTMQNVASALETVLPNGWKVFAAMRYGRPGIAQTLAKIQQLGIEELVVVPMFPQFSLTTTGTVIRETYRALREKGEHLNVATRAAWSDDIGYINAQVRLLAEYVKAQGLTSKDTYLLFSSHGLPVSYIERGDPYLRHVQQTVKLVTNRLGWPMDRTSLAFQSPLGPTRWLGPDTKERLAELAEAGEKRVLVCPISFTIDCLETLEEIDLRYREILAAKGGQLYLCPCLNTYKPFIAALKNLVLRGPQPMTSWGMDTASPLSSASVDESELETTDADLKSLVMIGASLQNRVGRGRGPLLYYSDPDELCCVKKSHEEVHAFLEKIRAEGSVREALVWNTCHRFEFYGWLKNPQDAADRECVIGRTWHLLFGEVPDGLGVNVLFGAEAWHHLMRTVAGLNSGLPGDRDVIAQLQTAQRLADHAGMGGPRSRHLVERAVAMERELRNETAWGRYGPGYCLAAFSRIRKATGLKPAECSYTAIGGSTTSRSVLEMLCDTFDVPKRRMTIVYRGHKGGQMKLLRAAIGNGKRVRVQSYSEPAVIQAIAQSDVVFFGTDRDEPVLDARALRRARDFTQRPLIILDFNTFGSTSGVETIKGVTVWKADRLEQEVRAYADAMCAQEDFIRAAQEADAWIESRLPELSTPYFEPPCKRTGGASPPVCSHRQRSNADEAVEVARTL